MAESLPCDDTPLLPWISGGASRTRMSRSDHVRGNGFLHARRHIAVLLAFALLALAVAASTASASHAPLSDVQRHARAQIEAVRNSTRIATSSATKCKVPKLTKLTA